MAVNLFRNKLQILWILSAQCSYKIHLPLHNTHVLCPAVLKSDANIVIKFYRYMTCWSCTMIAMYLRNVCCLKFLQLGKWVILKNRIVVPAEFRNTDEWWFTLCTYGLLAFYLGNRGCKVAGIWRHTDTFNLCLQVVFFKKYFTASSWA